MGIIASETVDYLFSSGATNTQSQLTSLANTALGKGIDLYQKGEYGRAITAFKRSAGYAPFSENSAKAYDYIAKAYLAQDKTAEAIKTYKQAMRIYSVRDDFHLALGDIYAKDGNAEEALAEYKAAVKLNPISATSRYALGQSYFAAGQLSDAREQFKAVTKLSRVSATGYYGLGQVARASGDYSDAVAQLNKAISVEKKFDKAYLELGYTYADMGNVQKATEQVGILSAKRSSFAATLENYMAQVAKPQIMVALGLDGFNNHLGAKTKAATMDADLTDPNSTKLYSMNFVFTKEMDISSIQNTYNWSISRASIAQSGGVYNNGLTVPSTEASIRPIPVNVTYNNDTNTAILRFRVSQNAAGNATLDPAHIVFKFYGKDNYGKTIDTSADQYSGFRGVA